MIYPAQPYPARPQGYYQGPPVMAPPPNAAPPPRRESGFIERCLAALRCFFCIDEYCGDPPSDPPIIPDPDY